MAQRVRNRISNEHRHRIVRAFEEKMDDYLLVADTLGINRSTVRGIKATYVREGRTEGRPRVGRNNVKVDDDMKDCRNNIPDENCMLTLNQINQELRNRCPTKPHVHQRTIAKALDGIMVTVKFARPVPTERNRLDVIDRRHQYANWFMAEGVINYCIFISINVDIVSGRLEATVGQE